jgi:DNA-binding NtrC family response regulator
MEVLRQIKQRDQQPVVLVLSAVADQAIATNAMSLGAHEFLLKPCDLNILQFTLEHALIRKSSG